MTKLLRTLAVALSALLAFSLIGVGNASAGKKIRSTSFGLHSFQQQPGVNFGSLRMNMWPNWRQLNPAQGQYAWDIMDATIAQTKTWGAKDRLYVFGVTPEWAGDGKAWAPERELGPGEAEAPASMSYYRTFATQLVKRYADDLNAYQAWNEITSPQFWQGTAKQMAKMTEILNKVVNKYDPSATVVSGSVQTHAQAYYDRIAPPYFAALRSRGWPIDVASGHFYPTGNGGPERRMQQIAMFQRDLKRYGKPKRVKEWDTEANFWTSVPGRPVMGRLKGRKAATFLARNYLDTWRTGLERSYWYMWTVGTQDLGFPGIQLRSDTPWSTNTYNRLRGWTVGSTFNGCSTKGRLVTCTFNKGGKFQIAFTTSGKATAKVSGRKSVCPVYGGGCVDAKGSTRVSTLPVKIG